MTRIVLVRHGQSTWNAEGRLQGQTMDIPLTAAGLDQAERAAHRVSTLVAAGTPVLSSDQRRALQTARAVAERLGSTVRPEPRLREQDLGRMEGHLPGELTPEPTPEGLDVADVRWGGGESLADVAARSLALLSDLARPHDGVVPMSADPEVASPHRPEPGSSRPPAAVVLVGHGDSLRVMEALLAGRSHRECDFDLPLGNGEVIVRDVDLPALVAAHTRR